jgi:hypothetical protein
MYIKKLISLALVFIPITIYAQKDSKSFITFEPTVSLMSVTYNFGKPLPFYNREYYKNTPLAYGGKVGFFMPQYYSGIAIQYNTFSRIMTGFDFNFNPIVPNDPVVPRNTEVEYSENQFSVNPYVVLLKNKPIKLTIGPIFTFIKNKYINEVLYMKDGKEDKSSLYQEQFNTATKTSTGAALNMVFTKKQFCFSLNSSYSILNQKYFNQLQEKVASVFQFGIGIGYCLESKKNAINNK